MTTQLDISLIDIFDIYEEKYTHNLKPSYKTSQKRLFENCVKPYFNDVPLKLIKKNQIYEFQRSLKNQKPARKDHLSPHNACQNRHREKIQDYPLFYLNQ
ncbi:hypothetical protein ACIMRC_000213 [Enterococcus hirae]